MLTFKLVKCVLSIEAGCHQKGEEGLENLSTRKDRLTERQREIRMLKEKQFLVLSNDCASFSLKIKCHHIDLHLDSVCWKL